MRLRGYQFDCSVLADMCFTQSSPRVFSGGPPAAATFKWSFFGGQQRTIVFVFEHESFPDLSEFCVVPVFNIYAHMGGLRKLTDEKWVAV